MTLVFTLEAIAVCAANGHRFAWQRAHGNVGFNECLRCGETQWPSLRGDAPLAVEEIGIEGEPTIAELTRPRTAARRPRQTPKAERNAEIVRRAAAGESHVEIARTYGIHPSRVGVIARKANPNPRPDHSARDAEIARRVAAGEMPSVVARAFGIDASRVSQIVKKAAVAAGVGA